MINNSIGVEKNVNSVSLFNVTVKDGYVNERGFVLKINIVDAFVDNFIQCITEYCNSCQIKYL